MGSIWPITLSKLIDLISFWKKISPDKCVRSFLVVSNSIFCLFKEGFFFFLNCFLAKKFNQNKKPFSFRMAVDSGPYNRDSGDCGKTWKRNVRAHDNKWLKCLWRVNYGRSDLDPKKILLLLNVYGYSYESFMELVNGNRAMPTNTYAECIEILKRLDKEKLKTVKAILESF